MTTNVYEFGAALQGVARPSQFRVHINFPATLVTNSTAAKKSAALLVRAGSLPAYNSEDLQMMYRGRQFHESGEPTYQPWSCTVYNSSDFAVRTALEEWFAAIHDPEVVYGITRPENYKSTILVEQLDRAGNTLRVYKLVGAFPSEVGQVQLDYESGNQAETYEVNFIYDYFVVGGTDLLDNVSSSY